MTSTRWLMIPMLALACPVPADAQVPTAVAAPAGMGAPEHRALMLELGGLSAGLSYSIPLSGNTLVGFSTGGGAQLGVMLALDEFTDGDYGVDRTFAELLHAGVFLRLRRFSRLQIELGPRVAWLYHPPTEHETIFYGAHGALFVDLAWLRNGRVAVGPRLQFGHLSEKSGRRSSFNLGLVPVAARLELRW